MKPKHQHEHGVVPGDRRDGLKDTAQPKPGYAFSLEEDTFPSVLACTSVQAT